MLENEWTNLCWIIKWKKGEEEKNMPQCACAWRYVSVYACMRVHTYNNNSHLNTLSNTCLCSFIATDSIHFFSVPFNRMKMISSFHHCSQKFYCFAQICFLIFFVEINFIYVTSISNSLIAHSSHLCFIKKYFKYFMNFISLQCFREASAPLCWMKRGFLLLFFCFGDISNTKTNSWKNFHFYRCVVRFHIDTERNENK